jgi:hypothetical protein
MWLYWFKYKIKNAQLPCLLREAEHEEIEKAHRQAHHMAPPKSTYEYIRNIVCYTKYVEANFKSQITSHTAMLAYSLLFKTDVSLTQYRTKIFSLSALLCHK